MGTGSNAIRTALALGLAMRVTAQVAPELIKVMETGPRDKRVNMVIIGDGYTAAEKSKFQSHLQMIADGVLKAPPLSGYAAYFNVYAVFVASNQSGADDPARGLTRDTHFNARYNGRLLTIDDRIGISVIDKLVPEADMRFAVVNDQTYGGSGGQVAVANYADPEIIAHEAQHSFSKLGDEYDYAGTAPFEAPNTTTANTRATVRWSHWIAASTPVPTPETATYKNLPGLFEGAAYNASGWYRPKQNCRMRENNIPFCEVCMEAILLSVYDKVSPLDSASPRPGSVSAWANEAPALRVTPKRPSDHPLRISWVVDGVAQADQTGPRFDKVLLPGRHTVVARVADTTSLVRKDPLGLLSDSAAWQVNVSSTARARGPAADAPALIRADARQAWLRVPAGTPFRIRLSDAAGRMIESRGGRAARDAHWAWRRALPAGTYVAELSTSAGGSALRFSVAP